MTLSTSRHPAAADGAPDLGSLRVEIDRIDAALHGLLMERGAIIDQLIAVKARGGGGSAFRPGREAQMMRRLVQRHAGLLPLDTVEGIWRIIISTFTYVQAPYAVHADTAGGDAAMRDSCRFHFGFTVPLVTHAGPAAVIAAVAAAGGDLGLVRADSTTTEPWWESLAAPEAPKVIARLPFVERADHAAGLPLLVVAKPLADAAASEVQLYAIDAVGLEERVFLKFQGVEVVASSAQAQVRKMVVAVPETVELAELRAASGALGWAWIGSHARRFDLARHRAGSRPVAP